MKPKATLSASGYKCSQKYDIMEAENLKIRSIDKLPVNIARNIKRLNISHNSIQKLENIQQFDWLIDLDISYNSINKCSEIMRLAALPKLMRLYLIGNPFLDDPLDEDVLQLLIQKETDIQILSNQNLNRIKELQQGQLKVIFLQNYLKKMTCHQQIVQRHFPELLAQRNPIIKQQQINKLIINKIMPQFYQVIDDPKLRNKVKRQTVGLKREEQITFQDAMKISKQKQQENIDNLIKNILVMSVQKEQQKKSRVSKTSRPIRQEIVTQQVPVRKQQKTKKQSKPKMKTVGTNVKHIQYLQPQQSMQSVKDPNYLSFRRKLQRSKFIQFQSPYAQQSTLNRNNLDQQSMQRFNSNMRSPNMKQKNIQKQTMNKTIKSPFNQLDRERYQQNQSYSADNRASRLNLLQKIKIIQDQADALASACAQVEAEAQKFSPHISQNPNQQQSSNFYSFNNKIAASSKNLNKVPSTYTQILKNPKFRNRIEISQLKQKDQQINSLRNKLNQINRKLDTQKRGEQKLQTPKQGNRGVQTLENRSNLRPSQNKVFQSPSDMKFLSQYSSKIDTKKIESKFFRDTNNFSNFNSPSNIPFYNIKQKQTLNQYDTLSPNKTKYPGQLSSPINFKIQSPPVSPSPEKPSHSYQFPEQFNPLNTSEITPNQLYEQYYNHLTKYNPTFALLYSDINTLSPEQKSVLIEALSKDHKNKTIQLFIQKNKVKNLRSYAIETGMTYERDKDDLIHKLNQYKQIYSLTKSYNQKASNQNSRLNALLKILNQDLANCREQIKKILCVNVEKDTQIKYLQLQIANRNNQLQNLKAGEEVAEVISQNRNKRLKAQMFQIIIKRAKQYYEIAEWKFLRQKRKKQRLLGLSWFILKRHLSTHILFKLKNNERQTKILDQCFKQWKQFRKTQIQLKKKQSLVKNVIRKKYLKLFVKTCKNKISKKKQHKLHYFWADHHLLKNYFYKLVKRSKISKQISAKKYPLAINHQINKLKRKIFNRLKQSCEATKLNIKAAIQKLVECKRKQFYLKLRLLNKNKRIFQEKVDRISALSRAIRIRLERKNKIRLIKTVKQQNQQLKARLRRILLNNKRKNLIVFMKNINKAKQIKNLDNKSKQLKINLFGHRVINKLYDNQRLVKKVRQFFTRIIKKDYYKQANLQRKSSILQECLKLSKERAVYYNLSRYMYRKRLFNIQVNRRVEQQQTTILVQKMRNLQQMEIQAIKSEYNKKMQVFQEQQLIKDLQYRNNMLLLEHNKKQMQDSLKMLRNELINTKQRQQMYIRQKTLIEQQAKMSQFNKNQLKLLNQNLTIELNGITTKYERILELYSQSMAITEKKDKQIQLLEFKERQREREKQRDKTVQKQKRIGVVKNGQYLHYRNKGF